MMHPARAYTLFMTLFGLGVGLHAATYVPFLLERGLSLSDVALINMFFWLSVTLSELPTGMLADGRSRALSIRAGTLIFSLGSLGYATASTVGEAILWESLLGITNACLSGAQQAWVTDALIARGERESIGRTFGTAAMGKAAGFLVGGAMSAVIGLIDLRLGFIATAAGTMIAFIVCIAFIRDQGEPEERVTEVRAFRMSWDALRASPGLVWAMAAAMVFGLVLPYNHYWSPFFRERAGQADLAWIWPATYGALVLAGWIVRRLGVKAGKGAGIVASLAIAGAGLALAGLPGGVALPVLFIMVHEMGRGLFEPMLDTFTQERVDSSFRATFGSFQSLIGRAGFAIVLVGVWLATSGMPSSAASIAAVWAVSGSLLAAAGISLWLLRADRR